MVAAGGTDTHNAPTNCRSYDRRRNVGGCAGGVFFSSLRFCRFFDTNTAPYIHAASMVCKPPTSLPPFSLFSLTSSRPSFTQSFFFSRLYGSHSELRYTGGLCMSEGKKRTAQTASEHPERKRLKPREIQGIPDMSLQCAEVCPTRYSIVCNIHI